MLSRLEREVKLCARMRNARQKPTLTFLQGHMVKVTWVGVLGDDEVEMLRDVVWAVD